VKGMGDEELEKRMPLRVDDEGNVATKFFSVKELGKRQDPLVQVTIFRKPEPRTFLFILQHINNDS
jgi:hypothetical protein